MDNRIFEIPLEHIENVLRLYSRDIVRYSVCEEECSELIKALSKYVRWTHSGMGSDVKEVRQEIVEELTHVAVCLGMLMKMFDISHIEIENEIRKKAEEAGFNTSNYSWLCKHQGVYEIPKYVKDEQGNVIVNSEWNKINWQSAMIQEKLFYKYFIDPIYQRISECCCEKERKLKEKFNNETTS